VEPGEPTYTCGQVSQSVWYAFTPAETASVTVRLDQNYYAYSIVTVFTGSSPANLTQVACKSYFYGALTFRATAGQTYYLQLGNMFAYYTNTARLSLDLAPPIQVDFSTYPYDPSVYDRVSYYDYSNDPGGNSIVSREWRFGDGATSGDPYPYHQYAADGDYTVQLADTTSDGRTGSASRVLQVRTHDVSINKFQAPTSASAGQTRGVSVYVRNPRYDDTVEVTLYKSDPSGYGSFVLVGSLTQFVAASPNRTVEFPFNYTFTANDATVGKVTFKAVAALVGTRDALPADNEAISAPTKVN